jgi:hypothetical protein
MESKKPHEVLDDPDAPPSEEELAEAASLREALADPSSKEPRATLARSLALAYEPREIDPAEHKAIVDRSLREGEKRSRGRVVRIAFGVSTVLALAAGVAAVLNMDAWMGGKQGVTLTLAVSRSTQPLFKEKFVEGEKSARIDRIASARAADLRENKFARWGVK